MSPERSVTYVSERTKVGSRIWQESPMNGAPSPEVDPECCRSVRARLLDLGQREFQFPPASCKVRDRIIEKYSTPTDVASDNIGLTRAREQRGRRKLSFWSLAGDQVTSRFPLAIVPRLPRIDCATIRLRKRPNWANPWVRNAQAVKWSVQ